jgi:hypothetical protein
MGNWDKETVISGNLTYRGDGSQLMVWAPHQDLTGEYCDGTGAEGVIASWELYP